MKNVSGLKKAALASAVAAGMAATMAAPSVAMAEEVEVSGTVGVSNLYLFRGADLSAGRPAVFGSLDAEHASGFYAGIWGSSEGPVDEGGAGTSEYDIYAGYAGEVENFSYDLGYVYYIYPNSETFNSLQEIYLGLGFDLGDAGALSAEGYFGVGETGDEDNRNNYYTLGYDYASFGALVGYADMDDSDGNYTHLDLSYGLTDELSFTVSQVVDQKVGGNAFKSHDPLFVVSYELSF